MKHVDITSRDGRYIKISDDVTYQEVGICCTDVDQANELIIKLIAELLKEN